MSRIEGITPPKKHKTIEQKRGTYQTHKTIHSVHETQKQKIAFIAGITAVVLVIGWIALAQSGIIFKPATSDSEFVSSLAEELEEVSATQQKDTVDTEEEQQLLEEYDKRLFPELHE